MAHKWVFQPSAIVKFDGLEGDSGSLSPCGPIREVTEKEIHIGRRLFLDRFNEALPTVIDVRLRLVTQNDADGRIRKALDQVCEKQNPVTPKRRYLLLKPGYNPPMRFIDTFKESVLEIFFLNREMMSW